MGVQGYISSHYKLCWDEHLPPAPMETVYIDEMHIIQARGKNKQARACLNVAW